MYCNQTYKKIVRNYVISLIAITTSLVYIEVRAPAQCRRELQAEVIQMKDNGKIKMKPHITFFSLLGDIINNPHILISMFALGCSLPISSYGFTIVDCTVQLEGYVWKKGVEFSGTASDIDGTETISFMYRTPSFVFETDSVAGSDDIQCHLNGLHVFIVETFGTGRLNGEPGYSYRLEMVDNGHPPPDYIPLSARLDQSCGNARNDGVRTFDSPQTVVIPGVLPVTQGSAGTGTAQLKLDHTTCHYVGNGTNRDYQFDRCTGPHGVDLAPGDTLDTSTIQLQILTAAPISPWTVVEIGNLGSGVWAHTPDTYVVLIANPAGELIYNDAGDLLFGDLDFTFISP